MLAPRKSAAKRLDKAQWLQAALDALAKRGEAGLRIHNLCKALGVSRGSFYWHFKDRADFVRTLVEYWHDRYTVPAVKSIESLDEPPEVRLLTLMHTIYEKNLAGYELSIRAWAFQDPAIGKLVKRTDLYRLRFLRGIFHDIGFRGAELETRTRAFLSFLMSEDMLFDAPDKKQRVAEIESQHAFFTRQSVK